MSEGKKKKEDVNISKNNLIEKSKPLIYTELNSFTALQLKVFETYLSKINARDPESSKVKFTKTEFCKLVNYKDAHSSLKSSVFDRLLRKLMGTVIEVIVSEDEKYIWPLFNEAHCYLDKESGESVVELECHEKLKPVFFNIKELGYTTYRLGDIVSLNSKYAIRLYSMLRDHCYGKYEWLVDVDEFKKLLSIRAERYNEFKFLNAEIIKKCQKEINENTNISFEYEKIKRGKRVIKILFKISLKNAKSEDVIDGDAKILEDISKPYWPDNDELNEKELFLKKINEEAFENSFDMGTVDYLVSLAEPRTKLLIDSNNQMHYFSIMYKKTVSTGVKKSKKGLLESIIKADIADMYGYERKKINNKEVFCPKKNTYHAFEERTYDFEEMERILIQKVNGTLTN